MKKLLVIWLVIALMLIAASPALAGNGAGPEAGPGPSGKGKFALSGVITAIDPANLTVTVHVVAGSTLVKPFIEQELTIQTTADTRFLLRNPNGKATPITFNDLAVDQNVSVNGTLAAGVWTAKRVTVGAILNKLP